MNNDLKWYSGDLHQHTYYSGKMGGANDDAFDSVQQVYDYMISRGLDFGAASDHHNILNHKEWNEMNSESFVAILSKEISTTCGHIMALNCKVEATFDTKLKDEGDEVLKAEHKRVTNFIRENGGFAQLNHPRDAKRPISFPENFTDIIDTFDTIEIWNGSEKMEEGTKNGKALALWFELLRKGLYIPATTGSDMHRFREYVPERFIKTTVYAEKLDLKNIVSALTKGHSFVTSNPFIKATINDVCYGETAKHNGKINVKIEAESIFEIDKLYIHSNVGVKEIDINCFKLDTSIELNISDEKWLVFELGSNTFNKAITNPIFLERE